MRVPEWMIPLSLLGSLTAPLTDPVIPDQFYNRPGATIAERAAEIALCRAISEGTSPPSGTTVRTSDDSPETFARDEAGSAMTLEACMVMRGWRIYALSTRDRHVLSRLAPKARAQALQRLCGAVRPAYGRMVQDGNRFQLIDPGAR